MARGAGLGDGGQRLHYWIFGGPWDYDSPQRRPLSAADKQYMDEAFGSDGAWLVGRTMHDVVDGWGDTPGFAVPVFVVTHRPRPAQVKGDTTFEYVTSGAESALARARTAVGNKDVRDGGANLLGQYLAAGVIDELTVTIAPVVMGSGKRLFSGSLPGGLTFEQAGVVQGPFATHLRYRLTRSLRAGQRGRRAEQRKGDWHHLAMGLIVFVVAVAAYLTSFVAVPRLSRCRPRRRRTSLRGHR